MVTCHSKAHLRFPDLVVGGCPVEFGGEERFKVFSRTLTTVSEQDAVLLSASLQTQQHELSNNKIQNESFSFKFRWK